MENGDSTTGAMRFFERPTFQLPPGIVLPAEVLERLQTAWQERYAELYEDAPTKRIRLSDACRSVAESLGDPERSVDEHLRWLCMGLALAMATRPHLERCLEAFVATSAHAAVLERVNRFIVTRGSERGDHVPMAASLATPQALAEGQLVFVQLQAAIDAHDAKEALLEVVDLSLEGYAVFVGSADRRRLFDWWLFDVVPRAFWHSLPAGFAAFYL